MKINCGPTRTERLREAKALDENRKVYLCHKMLEWHKVFAWLPVRVTQGGCRWLECVSRRYPDAIVSIDRWSTGDVILTLGLPVYSAYG